MPSTTAYHRAPLMDLSFMPLPDSNIQLEGNFQTQLTYTQNYFSKTTSPINQVIFSKLYGTAMPSVQALPLPTNTNIKDYIQTLWAKSFSAIYAKDKQALLSVLESINALTDSLATFPESELFPVSADLLRMVIDLYRRTGQATLLELLTKLRAILPDVSSMLSSFPFTTAYTPQNQNVPENEKGYYERMQRMATGCLTADCVAISALFSQFSGSAKERSSVKTGVTALQRYHGMPCGGFSADPFLAGKDPARALEIPAIATQLQAYADALMVTGDIDYANLIELLYENALSDVILEKGIRTHVISNRLANDETCQPTLPNQIEISALFKAMWTIRKTVWLAKDENTIAYMLPMDATCTTRMNNVPVRVIAHVKGTLNKSIHIRTLGKEAVGFKLQVRIPNYAIAPIISFADGSKQEVPAGTLQNIQMVAGEEIYLTYQVRERVEIGYRNSISIFVGPLLMGLPILDNTMPWQYALIAGGTISVSEENNRPIVHVVASSAPTWLDKNGFIAPPPQGLQAKSSYDLSLLPARENAGHICCFPVANSTNA